MAARKIRAGIVHCPWVKPLDVASIGTALEDARELPDAAWMAGMIRLRREELDRVGIRHDHAGAEHDLGHVFDVPMCDQVFQPKPLAGGNRKHKHHGEAAEHGAGDKVGWENG